MPLLARKKVLLAKLENTYNTDPVPTGAANAIQVTNLEVDPIEGDPVERNIIRAYLGNSSTVMTQVRATCNFTVEFAGSGAAGTAPAYGPLFRACSLSETVSAGVSVTYQPVSTTPPSSVTLYINTDGVNHVLRGARGTFDLGLSANGLPVINFQFTGNYVTPADVALPSATYQNQATPVVASAANTTGVQLHSFAGVISELGFSLGNDVQFRDLIGAANAEVLIVDRRPTATITMDQVTLAQKDYYTAARNATPGNFTFQHGQTAGNRITLTCPAVTISNISYGESQGINSLSMDTRVNPNTGNDEFTLVYT